jgi:hypothetical protein
MHHMLPRRLLYIAETRPSKPILLLLSCSCGQYTQTCHVESEVPSSKERELARSSSEQKMRLNESSMYRRAYEILMGICLYFEAELRSRAHPTLPHTRMRLLHT